MIMTKEVFQDRINAGKVVQIGRFSCRLLSRKFYFFAEETEVFDSFENLWDGVSDYILHGVNYFGENTE